MHLKKRYTNKLTFIYAKPEWLNVIEKLNSTAITSKSWLKYNTAYNNLEKFSKNTNTTIEWPLNKEVINGFVIWCISNDRMCPNTIKSYIYALSQIQQWKGLGPINIGDSMTKKFLSSAKNAKTNEKKQTKSQTNGTITLKKMQKLKKYLHKTLRKDDRRAVWAAMTVAFFGSFRMGELLAQEPKSFDKTSTLLWENVEKHKTHNVIQLKSPKSGKIGETVVIFPFPVKIFCPINALKKLESNQRKQLSWRTNMPVFRLKNGLNITKKFINNILKNCFTNRKHKISCKSFRCGIPSSLGNAPDIANDQHIKGWGRWNSNAFLRYEHFGFRQKKWIYDKIVMALLRKKKLKTKK
jgi:hypothetical protein